MALLDNLFSKKSDTRHAPAHDAGPTSQPTEEEQAMDRKILRLERRELLYAVVRESMARVGMLSSSYKYKVLSLDSRGNQYLIMMDLPKEMAEHIGQLAEIEEVITQNARMRHRIDVTAVYWRINELSKNSVLRKPRAESEFASPPPAPARELWPEPPAPQAPQPALAPGQRGRRFEPIRPDEVHAFKQALASGTKPGPAARGKPARSGQEFAPTEFPPTEFEATRLDEEAEQMPLSRTQYGDLI